MIRSNVHRLPTLHNYLLVIAGLSFDVECASPRSTPSGPNLLIGDSGVSVGLSPCQGLIIGPMDNSPSSAGADQSIVPLAREAPHLRIHAVKVFVRDQDESLRFYVDQLGFDVTFDA